MIGRRPSGPRMRSGLTLVELLIAIAVLGGLEVLLLTVQPPASPPAPPTPLSIAQPPPHPMVPSPYQGELGLQTTLDRLGFTVNVPHVYEGRRLTNSGGGRISTQSDALPSGWFEADGPVRFVEVSRQSDLGSVTTFAAETRTGDRTELLRPVAAAYGGRFAPCRGLCPGISVRSAGRTAALELRGTYRFSISFPPNGYTQGPLFSTAEDNPHGPQLLVLPARRGGTWVDEGENTGHWEGGADENGCLLCWEDTVHLDSDFQDLVIDAEGIQPAQR